MADLERLAAGVRASGLSYAVTLASAVAALRANL